MRGIDGRAACKGWESALRASPSVNNVVNTAVVGDALGQSVTRTRWPAVELGLVTSRDDLRARLRQARPTGVPVQSTGVSG
jgi:hypothetical protein